ncbi:MAG: hypothetical protein CBD78_00030 [Candidatus Thioglobus sp. TMED218]|nr:MAG: hypothetical protein CBD78_00030 [Candidatus Thioglobus sp. TMED218]|tara:strand:- start:7500 stop:7889 length:390 start_codon:yes stop_codon:yes gene_type:complete
MATFKGNSGVVKVGSTAVAELRSYSITETAETIDDTAMGDTYRSVQASLKSFNGSLDVYFDDTDSSGQGALTVGAAVTVEFLMEGSASGAHKLSGSAIVTDRTITGSSDSMVEASLSIQGNGGLTEATV